MKTAKHTSKQKFLLCIFVFFSWNTLHAENCPEGLKEIRAWSLGNRFKRRNDIAEMANSENPLRYREIDEYSLATMDNTNQDGSGVLHGMSPEQERKLEKRMALNQNAFVPEFYQKKGRNQVAGHIDSLTGKFVDLDNLILNDPEHRRLQKERDTALLENPEYITLQDELMKHASDDPDYPTHFQSFLDGREEILQKDPKVLAKQEDLKKYEDDFKKNNEEYKKIRESIDSSHKAIKQEISDYEQYRPELKRILREAEAASYNIDVLKAEIERVENDPEHAARYAAAGTLPVNLLKFDPDVGEIRPYQDPMIGISELKTKLKEQEQLLSDTFARKRDVFTGNSRLLRLHKEQAYRYRHLRLIQDSLASIPEVERTPEQIEILKELNRVLADGENNPRSSELHQVINEELSSEYWASWTPRIWRKWFGSQKDLELSQHTIEKMKEARNSIWPSVRRTLGFFVVGGVGIGGLATTMPFLDDNDKIQEPFAIVKNFTNNTYLDLIGYSGPIKRCARQWRSWVVLNQCYTDTLFAHASQFLYGDSKFTYKDDPKFLEIRKKVTDALIDKIIEEGRLDFHVSSQEYLLGTGYPSKIKELAVENAVLEFEAKLFPQTNDVESQVDQLKKKEELKQDLEQLMDEFIKDEKRTKEVNASLNSIQEKYGQELYEYFDQLLIEYESEKQSLIDRGAMSGTYAGKAKEAQVESSRDRAKKLINEIMPENENFLLQQVKEKLKEAETKKKALEAEKDTLESQLEVLIKEKGKDESEDDVKAIKTRLDEVIKELETTNKRTIETMEAVKKDAEQQRFIAEKENEEAALQGN